MNNFTKAFFTTKSKSIKWVFALLTLLLLNVQASFSQVNYVTWNFATNITSANYSTNTTNQNAARSTALTNATLSTIALSATAPTGGNANTFHRTTGWTNSASVNTAQFLEYSITLTAGQTFQNSTLNLAIASQVSSTTTAPRNYSVYYGWGASPSFTIVSGSNAANATPTSGGTVTTLTMGATTNNATIPAPGNTTTTILTIRISAFGTTSSTGNYQITSMALTAASQPIQPVSTFTMTYNGNSNTGGTVPTDSNTYTSGDPVSTLGNTGTLTRTNFDFSGWNTLATGLGTSYTAPQASAFNISANTTLYAKWTGTVTYNGNGNTGGTAPTAATGVIAGDTYTVANNTGALTNTGFTFGGWNTQTDGLGANYTAGSGFFAFAGNITLYAKWNAVVNYTVTYSGNGNTGGTAPTDGSSPYVSGSTVSTLGNTGTLTRTNFDFSGWNTLATGLGTSYAAPQASAFTISANTTLHAKWTGTVTYNGNGNTGGTAPSAATGVIAGATYTVAANSGSLVKTGLVFGGWNTQADGLGTNYTAGSGSFAFAGNITLYAKWDSGPCLTQGNFTATPSGWAQTSITYATNEANFASNNGELTTIAVSNPGSLTFDLRRSGSGVAKTLYVEVSTTTQGGSYTTVATYDHSNTTVSATTPITVDLSAYASFSTVFIKFRKASATNSPWYLKNVNVYCIDPATVSLLDAYGSQPSGNIASGTNDAVLAGFSVTPGSSANFTSVTLTGTSTPPSDISNVRIFRDNNGDGIINGADASVSGAGIAFANGNLSAMTITGETGFSTVRNYIVVADVSASPTSTSVGVAIGSGNFVTGLATNSGSMAINTRAITVPTSTLAAYSTQLSGSITKGSTNVPIAGFTVTPTGSTTFSAVTITGSNAAVAGDITNVRIFRDFNGDGIINTTGGTDASVSGAGVAFVNGSIAISGMTESISAATSYLIVANISGTATSTTFRVSIGSGAFTTTLSNAGSMAFVDRALIGSALSDIIRSSGFTEPTNIAYDTYQSSTITTGNLGGLNNIKIAEFTIRDGALAANDTDGLGTILNSLTFSVPNFANLKRLALVDGATVVSDVAVSSSSVAFSSLTLTAADNGSKTFSVYASFNTTVTDNQNIGLTVSAASASSAGSTFAAANAGAAASVVTGNSNKIVVTATQLLFGTVAGNSLNANLTGVTISTVDANNNIDTDQSVSLTVGTTSVTGTNTISNPYSLTSGTITISTISFNTAQNNIRLTAVGGTFSSVQSNPFTIFAFPANSYRSVINGGWTTAAVWQQFVSGTWTATGPPGNSETNTVYINNTVTTGSINPTNLIVESGGTLTLSGSGTYGATSMIINSGGVVKQTVGTVAVGNVTVNAGGQLWASAGTRMNILTKVLVKSTGSFQMDIKVGNSGTLELEDGSNFYFNYSSYSADGLLTDGLWSGTEKFWPNSNFYIQKHSGTTTDYFLPSKTCVTSNTLTSGSTTTTGCFGNLIYVSSVNSTFQLFNDSYSSNINITHQDLILRSTAVISGSAFRFSGASGTSGSLPSNSASYTATIGRDFIIESTWTGPSVTLSSAMGYTHTLTVGRDFKNESAKIFNVISDASGTLNFNVNRDMIASGTTGCIINVNASGATSTVKLKGNLTIGANAILSSAGVSTNVFNFNGGGPVQTINITSTGGTRTSGIEFRVNNLANVQLATRDLELGANSKFIVDSGGTLDFGFNGSTALNVTNVTSATGTSFTLTAGGTLKITSPQGIMASAASGNVLTNSRTFNQGGSTFHYMGKVNQNTGDVYTSDVTAKKIICDLDTNALTLTLDVPTGTSNELYIKKGIFIDTDTNRISGTGALTIDADGTFRSGVLTATGNVPLLSGTKIYDDGSTIELNATAAGQTLEGGDTTPQYKNLIFSNGGTKVTTAHNFDIKGTVTVQTGTTLDVSNNTFGAGTISSVPKANLKINGTGIFKASGTGVKPDIEGTYDLAATSTVEFYGTSATDVRKTPTTGIVTYGNVIINGSNVTIDGNGITLGSLTTFTVKDNATLNVKSDAGFTGGANTAVKNTFNPTITLEPLSTINYNGASQTVTGRTYANLTIDQSSGNATLNGDTTVNKVLNLINGKLITNASFKAITAAGGSVTRTNGWVNGNLQRYVGTSTSAITYDIGSDTVYTPVALTFASSSTGTGSVMVNQTNGIHPNSSTAAISPTKRVNRYYTLTNVGAGTVSYSAVFNFDATDVLGGADTNAFKVGNYNPTTWTYPTVGTKTATSTQATGLTTFGDFLLGECTPPIAYTVTGGGAYCFGSAAPSIGLSDSQVLVNYQLKLDGVDVGAPIAGTGAALDFGVKTAAGVYSIVADNGSCTATMNSSKTISINPLPTATMSINNSSTCQNDTAPIITFTGANGTGVVRYKFYYKINGGSELSVTSLSGVSTATVSVPTGTLRTDVYTLVRVEDVNTGCNQNVTVSNTQSVIIGICTSLMNTYRGITLDNLYSEIYAISVSGATGYRFEVTPVLPVAGSPIVVNSTTRSFNLSQLGLGVAAYSTTYSIRVAVNNGGYAYGLAYTISTPAKGTKMMNCGTALDNLYAPISAFNAPYATMYRFYVRKVDVGTTTIETPSRTFSLSQLTSVGAAGVATYGTNYKIAVEVYIDNAWVGLTSECDFFTPAAVTKLMNCGSNLAKLNTPIFAFDAPLAVEYRFEVTEGVQGANTNLRTFDSPTRSFNLTQISPIGVGGVTYNVRVAIKLSTGGPFQGYSSYCKFTTPAARMAAQDINTNVFEVKAFPNPFARHFSLDIQSSSDDLVQVQVYDMIGRELEVQKATVSELSTKEIGTNYPSGVYNVIVSQGDKVRSVRMIKR